MKRILQFVSLGVISAACFASDQKIQIEEILRHVRLADQIVVRSLGPVVTVSEKVEVDGVVTWKQLPPSHREVTISSLSDIAEFAELLVLSPKRSARVVEMEDAESGELIDFIPACGCQGDYECSFVRDGKESLRFIVSHAGRDILISLGENATVYDLEESASEPFDEILAQKFRRANHSPQPTAGDRRG